MNPGPSRVPARWSGLAPAAVLAAALAGGGQSAQAQGAHAGHDMTPATIPRPGTSVNLGQGATGAAGGGGTTAPATSIVHTGHEALYGVVLIDQLEFRGARGSQSAAWEGQVLYGSDYNKVRVSTRGEYSGDERAFERAELQILYSRLTGYFFDAQVGVRQDFPIRPREGTPARTHLVVGLQGLLPNLFEVNLQGFVNHRGTVSARAEASYDLYITQRLVLQPEVELNFAANADRQARLGKGLTKAMLGKTAKGGLLRKAGIMGVVRRGGTLRPGDAIVVALPPKPHRPLVVV